MADDDLPKPEPKEIDEKLALQLKQPREDSVLKGQPYGDERCDNCLYYLNPDDKLSYCWHPKLRILVGGNWWCSGGRRPSKRADQRRTNRSLAIGLALGAALLLAFAAFSRTWSREPNGIGFGPMGCSKCNVAVARSVDAPEPSSAMSNSAFMDMLRATGADDRYTSSAFAPMGWATFGCACSPRSACSAPRGSRSGTSARISDGANHRGAAATMLALITGACSSRPSREAPAFVGVAMASGRSASVP